MLRVGGAGVLFRRDKKTPIPVWMRPAKRDSTLRSGVRGVMLEEGCYASWALFYPTPESNYLFLGLRLLA